jgi:hypothetical protein
MKPTEYVPPQVMRMGGLKWGQGDCQAGSSDAEGDCQEFGGSAGYVCDSSGSTAGTYCQDGSTPTLK